VLEDTCKHRRKGDTPVVEGLLLLLCYVNLAIQCCLALTDGTKNTLSS
jgi:hypothetical protein